MSTRWMRWAVACALPWMAGCMTTPLQAPRVLDEEVPRAAPIATPQGRAGGVFSAHAAHALTADQRAHRAGDVLTVMLQETTQASKRADTRMGKESSVSVRAPVMMGQVLRADVGLGADRGFSGGASSTQQNALSGSISVIVQEVLPNGLLRIRGDRALTLNQGEEVLRLAGYVRATDIDPGNRVSSQRIANARISYSGHGELADANRAGWLTRFFNSPLFPF
jgi:flagellar L-ring protein FlgH